MFLKYAEEQLAALLREHIDALVANRRAPAAVPVEVTAHYLASALLGTVRGWLENDVPYPAEQAGRMYGGNERELRLGDWWVRHGRTNAWPTVKEQAAIWE